MFPDLLRDDIFQLETRRLWLRWPRASDAPAIAALVGERDVAEMTARIPHPYPKGAAAEFVLDSRAKNLAGKTLNLVLAPKARPSEAIGCIGLSQIAPGQAELGYWLGKPHWGRGLMFEAASGLLALARRVSAADTIHASALKSNPASRRVLEKCGFIPDGEGVIAAPARGGEVAVERFALSRHGPAAKSWAGEAARCA